MSCDRMEGATVADVVTSQMVYGPRLGLCCGKEHPSLWHIVPAEGRSQDSERQRRSRGNRKLQSADKGQRMSHMAVAFAGRPRAFPMNQPKGVHGACRIALSGISGCRALREVPPSLPPWMAPCTLNSVDIAVSMGCKSLPVHPFRSPIGEQCGTAPSEGLTHPMLTELPSSALKHKKK